MRTAYESVDQFQMELQRREGAKQDYIVATKALRADDDGVGFRTEHFAFRPTAHRQVANWAGIPFKYYNKMSEVPGLRAYNLQQWYNQSEDKRMLRTLDGQGRAFLSNKYMAIDNLQVMDAAAPAFAEFPDLKVKSVNLTDDRMYVQFMMPSLQAEIFDGDVVEAGVCFTNSETGQGAIDVQMMMWRMVCTNGMVASSVLRRYHVGRRVGGELEDYGVFKADTISAELESYKLRIRDVLSASLNQDNWQKMVTSVKTGAEMPVHSPEPTIENVTTRYGLTKEERDQTMVNFIGGGKSNRWNLSNAITLMAQSAESPDRQYDLEKIGWGLATMPTKEWNEIAPRLERPEYALGVTV